MDNMSWKITWIQFDLLATKNVKKTTTMYHVSILVSWWYIRKRLQKGTSSANSKWREGRYFSPWQKIMSNIWVKNSKSETKVAMSVHDYLVIYDIYVAASNKKIGSAAPLRNRGFVGWPQFQIINHFNSSNWLNLEDFLHILPWPKQYLTGEGWGWLVLQNGRMTQVTKKQQQQDKHTRKNENNKYPHFHSNLLISDSHQLCI